MRSRRPQPGRWAGHPHRSSLGRLARHEWAAVTASSRRASRASSWPDSPTAAARGRASPTAGTRCISSAAGVRDALLGPRARSATTSTSRPTPGPTRSRPCVRRLGRRGVAPGPALRHGRLREATACSFEITTFRADVYRPESRKPEVVVRRRHRDRPLAPRLHRQRDGARARRRARARRPVRRPRRPRGAAAAHAARRPRSRSSTIRCGCCGPRASSRRSGFEPDAELVDAIEQHARPARDRRARSGSATSCRSCSSPTTRRPGCGSSPRRGSPTSSCPSSTRCSSSRTRSTGTRTCSRTRSRSSRRRRPELRVRLAALLHDVGKPETRAVRPAGRHVPPPRGGRRAHGPRAAASRCGTRTRSSTTSRSSS